MDEETKTPVIAYEALICKIYLIHEQKVMLDFDLAELYETETKYLKRAVKSNIKRFPSDFMFPLSIKEWEALRCSFSTSKQEAYNMGSGPNNSDPIISQVFPLKSNIVENEKKIFP